MPSFRSNAAIETEESENAEIVVESTQIKNSNAGLPIAFHFVVLELAKNGDRQKTYNSRKTILDRPCWRDDSVSLSCQKRYTVEVFQTVGDASLTLYDTFDLGPLSLMRGNFATANVRTHTVVSNLRDQSYTLSITWNTAEFLKHV